MKKNISTGLFCFLFLLLSQRPARSAPAFLELSEDFGVPGTSITLTGTGLAAGQSYQVKVGGVSASIQSADETGIRFVVPGTATTGTVELEHEGQVYPLPDQFIVTRVLNVTFGPSAVPDPSPYFVGTWYGDAVLSNDTYPVQVATEIPTIVAASAGETDPGLFAIATDGTSSIQLTATSTAEAIIFMTPGITTADVDESLLRLIFIRSMPEIVGIAVAIESELNVGQDYLESPIVSGQIESAVIAFFNGYVPPIPAQSSPPIPRLAGQRSDNFANENAGIATGYPKDLTLEGQLSNLRKLRSSTNGTTSTTSRGLPIRGVKIGNIPNPVGLPNVPVSIPVNPLDWSAVLYQLDPTDPALDDPLKAAQLQFSGNTAFDRINPVPLDRLHIKAKPAFRIMDIIGLLESTMYEPISGAFTSKTQLDIPADRPGLYMIRAYSGARFPPQSDLIADLPDGRTEARRAMIFNLVMALQDAVSFVAGNANKDCLGKFVGKLQKNLATILEREGNQETLSGDTVLLLFLETSKTYVKDYILKCVILDTNRRGMGATAKTIIKQINLAGKIATVGKIGERIMALGNLYDFIAPRGVNAWAVQSVEDTLVVVGNPWEPVVTSFFPQEGYRGTSVRINGRHFSTVADENVVTFGLLTTSPEDPPLPARAEVVKATANSLVVKVPEDADTGAITVAIAGKGNTSSIDLPTLFKQFVVYDDPIITEIIPNPPIAGRLMQIVGENFAENLENQTLDYSATTDGSALVGSAQLILTEAPNSLSPNSVKIVISGRESNEVSFTPILPEVIPDGATITISTTVDNEAEDGDVTLREAIMIASGVLGRALTSPPFPRPVGERYETDHVNVSPNNASPGAASRDTIILSVNILNQTLTVGSVLPPLNSFDNYVLHTATIDGTGVDGPGLVISGKREISLEVTKLRGFGGHGILLSGGASDNSIRQSHIEDCGGDGIRLEGDATKNILTGITAIRCLNGIHLTGANVQFNKLTPFDAGGPLDGNQNFGLLLENGVSFNDLTVANVRSNLSGGIRLAGTQTHHNVVSGSGLTGALDNGGPGVWITSPSNLVHSLNSSGNDGDGFLLEGPDCHEVKLHALQAGYDFYDGALNPNLGSGIHIRNGASKILVGVDDVETDDGNSEVANETSYLAGNRDHGIWIEGAGTRDITLNTMGVGWLKRVLSPRNEAMANGTNGIAVTGGAQHVTIGGIHRTIKVRISNQTNGAAIYFAGNNTSSNVVFGCEIGVSGVSGRDYRESNKIGIHLTDGAFANVIGLRGDSYQVSENGVFRNYESRNEIRGEIEAGILLESGGDPNRTITEGEQPTGGNVIQNNFISGSSSNTNLNNRVGIWIRAGATSNRIGGNSPEEENDINYNIEAGILIDGVQTSRENLANRIIGNTIYRNGHGLSDPGDPFQSPPLGVGVGLINGSSGNIIGGSGADESNDIRQNQIGVYFHNVVSNTVSGNEIRQSKMGGIMLAGSSQNTIGKRNSIYDNGTATPLLGGILITNGIGNRVYGSYLGAEFGDTYVSGDANNPFGIGIFNSAGNIIGDHGAERANMIVGNTADGILVSGNGSTGNRVVNNSIGLPVVSGVFVSGNGGAGVHLENGAANNIIGGTLPVSVRAGVWNMPAGNSIGRNTGGGVLVEGNTTTGNQITYNSIADHTGALGIQNQLGGNAELPPPTITQITDTEVIGTVDSGALPDGSIVQVFSDKADEGKAYLSEATVVGGQFRATPGSKPFPNFNATVTHAVSGSTSEFSTPVVVPPELFASLYVERVTDPPENKSIILNGPPRISLPLKLTASGSAAQVISLTLKSTGSINEPTGLVGTRLIRDYDRDGVYSTGDQILGDPIQFTADDGSRSFSGMDAVILDGESQHWLVEVELDPAVAVAGETVQFEITGSGSIASQGLFPGGPITETGEFIIQSDVLTIDPPVSPTTFAEWQSLHFTPAELQDPAVSGKLSNPDGDSMPNIVEYAFGLDPRLPEESPVMIGEHTDGGDTFLTVIFPLVDGLTDLIYSTDTSMALSGWLGSSFEVLSDVLDSGIHTITLKLLPPIASSGDMFYRLNFRTTP